MVQAVDGLIAGALGDEGLGPLVDRFFEHGEEQFVLAAEVAVERLQRDVRALGDLLHREVGDFAGEDEVPRRVHDVVGDAPTAGVTDTVHRTERGTDLPLAAAWARQTLSPCSGSSSHSVHAFAT